MLYKTHDKKVHIKQKNDYNDFNRIDQFIIKLMGSQSNKTPITIELNKQRNKAKVSYLLIDKVYTSMIELDPDIFDLENI